jgi:hypothetical protein
VLEVRATLAGRLKTEPTTPRKSWCGSSIEQARFHHQRPASAGLLLSRAVIKSEQTTGAGQHNCQGNAKASIKARQEGLKLPSWPVAASTRSPLLNCPLGWNTTISFCESCIGWRKRPSAQG